MKSSTHKLQLAHQVAQFYSDPLGFVEYAYPWREKGTPLEHEDGPDANQRQFLRDLGKEVKARGFRGTDPVMPILMSASSGHGTGKTVLSAWIGDWLLSTRPHSVGTVTANTHKQLETRTGAILFSWTKLCITAPLFEIRKTGIYAKESPEDWKVVLQTCRKENAQAFAGQHAKNSTSWYMFDEASEIPDAIWDVAFGALTDGEPMFFAWGQPSRSNGRFYEICFGSQRNRWNHRTIDSRNSRFTNKELIEQWRADYGEDSDFFRVRVLGLPPRASDLQYIDSDRIFAAQNREAFHFEDDPLVVGLDVARGGKANSVFRFRRGMVIEVRFGAACPDPVHYANMRAWMWSRVREFLQRGAIDKDQRLATDLAGPAVKMDKQDRIYLESKEEMEKRGLDSPDDGDALALTFAQTILPIEEPPDDDDDIEGDWSYNSRSWMR
jgi:hypothetical protein